MMLSNFLQNGGEAMSIFNLYESTDLYLLIQNHYKDHNL